MLVLSTFILPYMAVILEARLHSAGVERLFHSTHYRLEKIMQLEDLRFGVVGWGYWGPKIARNLDTLPHASVAMIADQDIHRLASLKANRPWMKTTSDAEELFRSDVDAVVIVTPVRTH